MSLGGFLFTPSFAQVDYFNDLRTTKETSHPLVEWQHFGPGMSGYVDKFWIHDTDPNAMFTHLDMGNAHGTWDGGTKWQSIRDSDGRGATVMDGMTAVEFSHQDPDFGLLLAKDGVYSTTNRGRSWDFVLDIDRTNSRKHSVLTVDPTDDNVWYIGAGQHWMIKFTHFNKDGLIYSDDRNHSEGFILKSVDKGQSWTKITSVFPADSDFSKIIVDPRDSNNVYASNQHGIYRSEDAGLSWEKVEGNGLPHHMPRDMASFYDANNNEFYLYMVEVTHYTPNGSSIDTTGGVYRSSDGGANWDNLSGNLAIDLNQITSNAYIERYWRAIAYWLDIDIATARASYPTLPSSTFSQFIRIDVDPQNKDRIYLVHNFKHDYSFPPGNIWMTEDGGTSWIAAAREGLYWSNEVDRAYWEARGNPLGENVEYAHVQKEHSESDNTQTGPRFIKVNSQGDVFTAFAQQVMRSTDDGASWHQVDDFETAPGSDHWVGRGNSNLPGETLFVDTGTPGTYLFGAGEHGLWRNTDDGEQVYPGAIAVEQLAGQSTSPQDALSIASIAVHPTDNQQIYTLQFRQTQRGALRHSTDNGATWRTLSTPITFPAQAKFIKQRSLLIDPQNPDLIYFCVPRSDLVYFSSTQWGRNGPPGFNDYGIYKSEDGGLTWGRANNGIPTNKSVYRLAMDPNSPNILYAALNKRENGEDGGLYKSDDHGATWAPMSVPTGVESVNNIRIYPDNGDLYIATGTFSNDRSTGGAWVSRNNGTDWDLLFDMPNIRDVVASPVDPQVIMVNVGEARVIGNRNPGAYVSVDGGNNWSKINHNHGQPGRINTIEADPYEAQTFWASLHGTGFWKIDLSPLLLRAPGKIEAEHFSTAMDTTPENEGGIYRDDAVDLLASSDQGGGYYVNSTTNNEWLEYDIDVSDTANYDLDIRVAAAATGGSLNIHIDGNEVVSDLVIPVTGGEQQWQTITANLGNLSEGTHQVRVNILSGGFNLNWFEYKAAGASAPDNDMDGEPDATDNDDDNDGVNDEQDAFPFDPLETVDTDADGTGNNADTDDDNDGVNDGADAFPLDPQETVDTDADGTGNNADTDDDNDGVNDGADAFPLDPQETVDTDADGIGNNADTDDDNDGTPDASDDFPLDPTLPADTGNGGTGGDTDTGDDEDTAGAGSSSIMLLMLLFAAYGQRLLSRRSRKHQN